MFQDFLKERKKIQLSILLIAFVGFVAALAYVSKIHNQQVFKTQRLLVQEATAHFESIKNLRLWHMKYGGVFEKQEGRNLENKYTFSISSLNPKGFINQAEGFDKYGLDYLTQNPNEKYFYRFKNDQRDFDFIGVLKTESWCIDCHENYQTGEVRGGVTIHLPLENYRQSIEGLDQQYYLNIVVILAFFSLSAGGLILVLKKIYQHQSQIEALNSSLEIKVAERTREINQLYSKEHYLKDLLGTISEINETLIESYSLGSIISSSLEKIQHHSSYKIIFYGYFDGNKLHCRHLSGDIYGHFDKQEYSLEELKNNIFYQSLYNTISSRQWSLDIEVGNLKPKTEGKRAIDYQLTASIGFPMLETMSDEAFDVIAFWTDRNEGFVAEEIKILESMSSDISMALSAYKQRQLTEQLQQQQLQNYEETILAFVDMIEQRDAYTAGHTLRVAKYSRILAQDLGLEEKHIIRLEKAAILHDIGKIATPDTILLKPGKLASLEYDLIKNHVLAGFKMLSRVKMYADLAEIMVFHHEHYDGSGYPYGRKGNEIPFDSHIMIVADAFDAMTTNRIYKPRLSVAHAIAELERNSGSQFHPKVVESAKKCLSDISIGQTSQLPSTSLEQQRFSYFFKDNLTDLLNISYLQLILNQDVEYRCANIFSIRSLTAFNKKYSWKKGNELIVSIATQLKEYFPNAHLFRYEGDNFLALNKEHIDYDADYVDLSAIDETGITSLSHRHLDLHIHHDYEELVESLDIQLNT